MADPNFISNKVFTMKKLRQILSLIICFLMIMVVSIRRDHKVLGYDLRQEKVGTEAVSDTIKYLDDGIIEVNTTYLGKDIVGYAGNVPLLIRIQDDKILSVAALPNVETPDFFEAAKSLLSEWKGKTLAEAESLQVDAVSGATFSSKAIIDNMKLGISYAQSKEAESGSSFTFDLKFVFALLVSLMAALLPLFIKNRTYHFVQLTLNVIVLGFWTGSFLSYTVIVRVMSNGISLPVGLIFLILLITAFVYPLFGKKQYYCTHVCPLGSIQQLAAKVSPKKIRLSQIVVKRLNLFRELLWAVLMLLLWTGFFFDWMDYELFSAFIVQSASVVVIVVALLFFVLSFFVPRPYCRFVCPTGTLFKISEQSK